MERFHTPRAPAVPLLSLLLLLLAGGCHVPQAHMQNLRQLHRPDGKAERTAQVQSGIAYQLERLFDLSGIDVDKSMKANAETVKDADKAALENLVGLVRADSDNAAVLALQAEACAWLAVDSSYVLTRARAAAELGRIGRRLGLKRILDPPAEPASAEEVKEIFDGIVNQARPLITGEPSDPDELTRVCDEVPVERLDRAGLLRLLRATNIVLERNGNTSELAGLRSLRRRLAARAVGIAMTQCREDPQGRVRAGAVRSAVALGNNADTEIYLWALEVDMGPLPDRDLVALEALLLLSSYGPPAESRLTTEEWTERLIVFLEQGSAGRLSVWACRTLAGLTERPENLRPEVWIAWWRFERSAGSEGS